MKTVEQTTKKYARKSLMGFLEGAQTTTWIIGVIKSSGVRGQDLEDIFTGLQDYGDNTRWQDAYNHCQDDKML